MIGTEPGALFPEGGGGRSAGRCSACATCRAPASSSDVSFDLRAGEILGLFGLVGAGRSEVAQMLFGITPPDRRRDPDRRRRRAACARRADAMRLGISLLPEDRHQQGLVLQFPIRANETLPVLRRLADRLGLVDRAKEARCRARIRRADACGRDAGSSN